MIWDTVWEEIFKNQEWGKYPPESLIRFVARRFYKLNRSAVKLLEVGCGPGANVWYIAREGFDAYGIDGSKTAIERLGQRLKKEGLKAHLSVGDIAKLPYSDDFFDAVIDNECIYSNSEEHAHLILKEIRRVLKPKGYFYSKTFTDEMTIGKTHEVVGHRQYNNISNGPLSGVGLVRLMGKAEARKLYGQYFDVVSIDKYDYTEENGALLTSEWEVISQKT